MRRVRRRNLPTFSPMHAQPPLPLPPKQTLARGAATPVHHTLKSKLAEDVVRAAHGLAHAQPPPAPPPGQGRGGGGEGRGAAAAALPYLPPSLLLMDPRAAAHEVRPRRTQMARAALLTQMARAALLTARSPAPR